MVEKMKKNVLMFMAVSLLLTGCSDDDEKTHQTAKKTLTTDTGIDLPEDENGFD